MALNVLLVDDEYLVLKGLEIILSGELSFRRANASYCRRCSPVKRKHGI